MWPSSPSPTACLWWPHRPQATLCPPPSASPTPRTPHPSLTPRTPPSVSLPLFRSQRLVHQRPRPAKAPARSLSDTTTHAAVSSTFPPDFCRKSAWCVRNGLQQGAPDQVRWAWPQRPHLTWTCSTRLSLGPAQSSDPQGNVCGGVQCPLWGSFFPALVTPQARYRADTFLGMLVEGSVSLPRQPRPRSLLWRAFWGARERGVKPKLRETSQY